MKKKFSTVIELGGEIGSTFKSTFAFGKKGIDQLGRSIRELSNTREAIKKLDFRELEAARDRLAKAREEHRRLSVEIKKNPSSELGAKIRRSNAAVEAATTALKKKQSALVATSNRLKQAGVDTRNLARETDRLGSAINRTSAKLRQLQMASNLRSSGRDIVANARGRIFDMMALGAAVGAPIVGASHFEDSMADVKKNVSGLDDKQEAQRFALAIRQIGKDSPLGAAGVAKLVNEAGKIGMAKDDTLAFARITERMGVAFEMTAEQAADLMTGIKSQMGLSLDEVERLGDAINFVADRSAASAIGISEIMSRISGLSASVTGFSNEQIAALAATLEGVAPNSEIAATGIKNFILALTKGEAATNKQIRAWAKLGVAPKTLAKQMQVNAEGTMFDVLERLEKLPAFERAGVLNQLFGSESIGAIAPLIEKALPDLKKNFDMVAQAQSYAGSVSDEYRRKLETTFVQFSIFKSRVTDLGITIGNILLPPINTLLGHFGKVMDCVNSFAQKHSGLTAGIVGFGAALAGLAIGGNVLMYVIGGIKLLTGVVWALSTAMAANPLGLIIVGLAAVAAAIYFNYDKIAACVSWLGAKIEETFTSICSWIKTTGLDIGEIWSRIVNFVFAISPLGIVVKAWKPALDWVASKLDWFREKAAVIKSFFGSGGDENAVDAAPSNVNAAPFTAPSLPNNYQTSSNIDNRQFNITVNGAAGQSEDDLANRIMAKLRGPQTALAGGALYD